MDVNLFPVFGDFLRISRMPFSSKSLIWGIYCTEKNTKNTHNVGQSFNNGRTFEAFQLASYLFSITDRIGSLFLCVTWYGFLEYIMYPGTSV